MLRTQLLPGLISFKDVGHWPPVRLVTFSNACVRVCDTDWVGWRVYSRVGAEDLMA